MPEKGFDFEAFIAGVTESTITVPVYAIDNREKIRALEAQIEQLQYEPQAPTRLGQVPKATALAKQVKKLRDEMESSATQFTFKALDPDVQNKFIGRDDDGSLAAMCEQLAAQSVEPKLDAAQWAQVAVKLGAPRFNPLYNAATQLTISEVRTPDFSPATSEALSPKESDAS